MLHSTSEHNVNSQALGININVGKILSLILRHWYIYVITVILASICATFYYKNKLPTYHVEARILIGEGESRPGDEMLQGFALNPGLQNLDNQMLILSSFDLVSKTVAELPFEIDFYRKGFRSQASYYPRVPLYIVPGERGYPYHIEFTFQFINEYKFHLCTSPKSDILLDTIMDFGQEIVIESGSFSIYPKPERGESYHKGETFHFMFHSKNSLTMNYMNRLYVAPVTREGGIVRLALNGPDWVKDVIFLNKLAEVYIEDNLEKKNYEANRIIQFIEQQLVDYSDSLAITEQQLQEFRSRERIMDMTAQAGQIIDQALALENEKARLMLERDYYRYLDEYLSKEENEDVPVAPASMGISDALLTSLMQELTGLQAEYYGSGVGERNPLQGQLKQRIENIKKTIRETLSGTMRANQMAIDENARQIQIMNREASNLPVKERQLLGFERKFNLNNVMYTYLLQERARAQIQSASNASDHELVEQARSTGRIAPDRRKIILFALALALALPTMVLLAIYFLDTSITDEEDVKYITTIPVLARFPYSRLSYNTVVLNEPYSVISEAFRSLRMRLEFIVMDKKCPLILVSSSIPGEGKTFSAINLASSYQLAEKKTLLIGFDLRRPTLAKSFELDSNEGLSSYLIGKKSIDDIICRTGYDNLDVIPAGMIPPNPGELAGSSKARELINQLKERYDIIVVDSPPIGVVSDIYQVASQADAVLLMVRRGVTKRIMLSNTLREAEGHGISNISLLMNGVKLRGSNYKYAYKYKYQQTTKDKRKEKRAKKREKKNA